MKKIIKYNMIIDKLASNNENFKRKYILFQNARSAFREILKNIGPWDNSIILLPAYIGWSSKEGSGVFDPIQELGIKYEFYKIDKSLQIDINHVKEILIKEKVKVFVIIHYFGFVDPNYYEVVKIARKYGSVIIEDEAHSFFTHFVGGLSGRLGDFSIFSLHKILPVKIGGMLITKLENEAIFANLQKSIEVLPEPWEYDFYQIAQKRRKNAEMLIELLYSKQELFEILFPELPENIIPQTIPILIHNVSRNRLYEILNENGFGVVSLYHTLIQQIPDYEFPDSFYISKRILNLPVHQDIDAKLYNKLSKFLVSSIKQLLYDHK